MNEKVQVPKVISAAERRRREAAEPAHGSGAAAADASPAEASPAVVGGKGGRRYLPSLDRPVRTSITLSPGVRMCLEQYSFAQRINLSAICEQALSEFFVSRGIKIMSGPES